MTPTDEQVEAALTIFDAAIAGELSKPRAIELALTAAFSLAAPAGTVLDSLQRWSVYSYAYGVDGPTVKESPTGEWVKFAEVAALLPPQPSAALPGKDVVELWQELLEKDDRTSPEEYPDHALITRDELADFIARSALVSQPQPEGEAVAWRFEHFPGKWYLSATDLGEGCQPLYLHPAPTLQGATFQQRVGKWMPACFTPEVCADKLERGDRLLEETFELLQSDDYPEGRIDALKAYTYSRPKGEPHQEVGGVMVTLAAYCLAHDLDMHQAGEDELARIWTKIDKIRAKQAAKPTGSALPVAVEPTLQGAGLIEALRTQTDWVKAALDCKSWAWDADQREAAELEHADALAVLAALSPTEGSREMTDYHVKAEAGHFGLGEDTTTSPGLPGRSTPQAFPPNVRAHSRSERFWSLCRRALRRLVLR